MKFILMLGFVLVAIVIGLCLMANPSTKPIGGFLLLVAFVGLAALIEGILD